MPLVELIKGMDLGVGTDMGGHLFGDAVIRTKEEETTQTPDKLD